MDLDNLVDVEGAIVTFTPRDARVHLGAGNANSTGRSISMRVELEQGEDVRLPNDQSLKRVRWNVHLVEATSYNDEADKQKAIGYLSHHEAAKDSTLLLDETCYISAALAPATFSSLLTVLESGRLPNQIYTRIRGLKYGWEPDGSGKVWDIAKTPGPSVLEIKFSTPLITSGEDRDGEQDTFDYSPPARGDIERLERSVAEALAALRRESSKHWLMLLCLILLIVAMLFFRR